MPGNQDQVFLEGEGDRWFERNRAALEKFDSESDLVLRLIDMYGITPKRVLEIGASSGHRLARLVERHGAAGTAVEPSQAAIQDGSGRYPALRFVRATSSDIPLQESFDLVIVNFVLHWVDRATLPRTVAEIDRLTAPGGVLALGDFLPAQPAQVKYHHMPEQEVFTYKRDYAKLFTDSGRFVPIGLLTAHHETRVLGANVADSDRIGTWLLEKVARQD